MWLKDLQSTFITFDIPNCHKLWDVKRLLIDNIQKWTKPT